MPNNNDDIMQDEGNLGGLGLSGMDIGEEKNDLDKIFDKMLSDDNIHHFTELNAGEITAFSTLGVMASKYKVKIVQKWILDNLKYRVSKGRKGKGEFVKITARGGYQENSPAPRSPWNLFRQN